MSSRKLNDGEGSGPIARGIPWRSGGTAGGEGESVFVPSATFTHDAPSPHVKATNPKDAVANDHVKFTDLPLRVLARVAPALSEGAWKYGRHNYRIAGVRATVYVNACLDHLLAWAEGEDIDPSSGFNHIDKAIAGLMVLRDSMLEGNWQDDRAPAVAPGWVEQAHADTKALYERMRAAHGEPKAPFTQANRNAPTAVVEAANEIPTKNPGVG